MPLPEDPYLRHLEKYEPDLEGWRFRAQRMEIPQPDSELHGDNKVFRHHPISDAARLSLVSAGEHLRLAWTCLKAGELYPTAHFTPLRSALVAASQAVYVLGPDDPALRRSRGLAVIVESYLRLKQFHTECLKAPGLTSHQEQQIQEQLVWLDSRIGGAKAAGALGGINITDAVIPYAANLVYGTAPEKEHSVKLLWRQMSGDAHALMWAMILRSKLDPPQGGQQLSMGTVPGSSAAIAQPFEASFRILKRGWSLFDQRSES